MKRTTWRFRGMLALGLLAAASSARPAEDARAANADLPRYSFSTDPGQEERLRQDPNAIVLKLFAAIERLSSYSMPAALPAVQRVPHSQIERDYCPHACAVIKAVYEPGKGVYMDNRLDPEGNLMDRSILLHELVHHVQAVTARYRDLSPCEQRSVEEREAFDIQNAYLRYAGSTMRVHFPEALYNCPAQASH